MLVNLVYFETYGYKYFDSKSRHIQAVHFYLTTGLMDITRMDGIP